MATYDIEIKEVQDYYICDCHWFNPLIKGTELYNEKLVTSEMEEPERSLHVIVRRLDGEKERFIELRRYVKDMATKESIVFTVHTFWDLLTECNSVKTRETEFCHGCFEGDKIVEVNPSLSIVHTPSRLWLLTNPFDDNLRGIGLEVQEWREFVSFLKDIAKRNILV